MGEVFEYEAEENSKNFSHERKADINEVLNYRKAMWHAMELLKDLPLCQRVIKEAHQILLSGVRGSSKNCTRIKQSETGYLCIPRTNKYRRRQSSVLKSTHGP